MGRADREGRKEWEGGREREKKEWGKKGGREGKGRNGIVCYKLRSKFDTFFQGHVF